MRKNTRKRDERLSKRTERARARHELTRLGMGTIFLVGRAKPPTLACSIKILRDKSDIFPAIFPWDMISSLLYFFLYFQEISLHFVL